MTACFRLFVCWTLICSAVSSAVAQKNLSPASVDQFVKQVMDSARIPGLSLAVVRDRKLAYAQGYGLTKSDSSQLVTKITVFDAASLSKPVFAYVVLQLVEEKLLDLDRPLYEYMPYTDVAHDERYKKITARLVLSHSSGFPNWRKNRQSNHLEMRFNPGERFGYSGEGFVYLQKVVEKLTGKPVNDIMTERVFKPLGMTRSSYVWVPAFDNDFAWPHTKEAKPHTKGKPQQANMAYSLQTTAEDYARFLIAVLTNKGLKKSTIDQMLSQQRQLPIRFSDGDSLSPSLFWGLGFGLETTPSGEYFWHWGDNGTFRCYVAANRQRGDAVVYFTNSFNGLTITDAFIQRFLGGTHPAVSFLDYGSYKPLPK